MNWKKKNDNKITKAKSNRMRQILDKGLTYHMFKALIYPFGISSHAHSLIVYKNQGHQCQSVRKQQLNVINQNIRLM